MSVGDGARPITRQRSPWEPFGHVDEIQGCPAAWHRRSVGDGLLTACVVEEPLGWHMSISFRDNRGDNSRYPRWDEITHAREALLPSEVGFVMHLPPSDEYVAVHDTTFHLHEFPERRS